MKTQAWTPKSLQRRTLLTYCLILICTAIALGVCYFISHQHNGLCDAKTSNHYFWTYTPTAWFTLLAFIWSQTEYRAKQMQPWYAMSQPQPASQSVLLDYISIWNVKVLWQSIKRKQVVVSTAVSVALLLQLLVVLSTALFTIESRNLLRTGAPMTVKDQFLQNGTNFDASKVDGRPAAFAMALQQQLDFATPPGTSLTQAYQTFQVPETTGNFKSAEIALGVFSSEMDCEHTNLQLSTSMRWSWGGEVASMSSVPVNSVAVSTVGSSSSSSSTHTSTKPRASANTSLTSLHRRQAQINTTFIDSVMSSSCGNVSTSIIKSAVSAVGLEIITCTEGSVEHSRRLLLWTSLISGHSDTQNDFAVICRPTYCFRNQTVSLQGSAVNVPEHRKSRCQDIPVFDIWTMFGALQHSVSRIRELLHVNTNMWPVLFEQWLQGGNAASPPSDSAQWVSMFQRSWSIFAAQTFSLYFREPDDSVHEGTVVVAQERLLLRELPFWTAECCLILCIGLCLYTSFSIRNTSLSRDPSSILGLATILARSPTLMASVEGLGTASTKRLRALLSDQKFEIHKRASGVEIRAYDASATCNNPKLGQKPTLTEDLAWYRPFSVSVAYMLGVPILLAGIVVLLEVSLHQSQVQNGFCAVSNPGTNENLAWTSLPAFAMSALALLVGLQLKTAKIFAVYSTLSSGSRNAFSTVARKPFDYVFMLRHVRHVEPFLLSSTASAVLASLLAIAVSGLLSASQSEVTSTVRLQREDSFMTRPHGFEKGFIQTDLILNSNLPFPEFTYDTLAISRPKQIPSMEGTLEIDLPVIQGHLNCTMVPSESIATEPLPEIPWALSSAAPDPKTLAFNAVWTDGSPCVESAAGETVAYNSQDTTEATRNVVHNHPKSHNLQVLTPSDGDFGGLVKLVGGGSCPGVAGAFGSVANHKIESLAIFTCISYASESMAKVEFQLPEKKITKPPTVHKDSAKSFDVKFTVDSPLDPLMMQSLTPKPQSSDLFDAFMKTLVYGTRGVPAPELIGPANHERLLEAMDQQHGISFAQYMNAYREPYNGSESAVLTGTLSTAGEYRLYQSSISTHILAALLSAILICTLITSFTMKSRNVLPKNPCSIAAVASLLADSDLVKMIPSDSDRLPDNELIVLFDGYSFSMGWWAGKEGEIGKRRFGIDFGTADNLL